MVVAIAVGRNGINTLLVASQVVLSVVLPFVAFPLIYLTSAEVVMRVRKPQEIVEVEVVPVPEESQVLDENQVDHGQDAVKVEVDHIEIVAVKALDKDQGDRTASGEYLDFSNGRIIAALSYAIWGIVLVANAYAIVMLFVR